MEYSNTARMWDIRPEEVKILRELFESRGYHLLREMEKEIKEGAMRDIEFSTDITTITRAQGVLKAFRYRDESLRAIFDMSSAEAEEEKEQNNEA